MFKRLVCSVFGHRWFKLVEHTKADAYGSSGIERCERCLRERAWVLLTMLGFDREVKRTYAPALRESLNQKNPLLSYLEENGD